MRRLFLAALGVLAFTGVAPAQQPRYPAPPAQYPTISPAASAAAPLVPASGATVIKGDGGCTNCGPGGHAGGPSVRGAFRMVTGGDCMLGYPCNNGAGSVKSDLAFQFGSTRNFFAPCGPTWGGVYGHKCPVQPFNVPWGPGWCCPRPYDSYANH